jgi:hypothetical protein
MNTFPNVMHVDPCPTCGEMPTGYTPEIEEGQTYISQNGFVRVKDMDRVMRLILDPCGHPVPTVLANYSLGTVTFPEAP